MVTFSKLMMNSMPDLNPFLYLIICGPRVSTTSAFEALLGTAKHTRQVKNEEEKVLCRCKKECMLTSNQLIL